MAHANIAVFSNVPQVEMLYKFITTQDLLVVAHANIAVFSNVPQVEMLYKFITTQYSGRNV